MGAGARDGRGVRVSGGWARGNKGRRKRKPVLPQETDIHLLDRGLEERQGEEEAQGARGLIRKKRSRIPGPGKK